MDYNSQKPFLEFPIVSTDLTLRLLPLFPPQTLYSTLPALLDSNPFTAGAELPGPGAELEAMPPGLRPTLGVFQAALELTSQCELHPDLVSQTFGYLFFFSNASLLNSLMERGEGCAGTGQELSSPNPGRQTTQAQALGSFAREVGSFIVSFLPTQVKDGLSINGLEPFKLGPTWISFWIGCRGPGWVTLPQSSSGNSPLL